MECVLYNRYSGFDHLDTDIKSVMSYRVVVLSEHSVFHLKYSWYVFKNIVGVMLKI